MVAAKGGFLTNSPIDRLARKQLREKRGGIEWPNLPGAARFKPVSQQNERFVIVERLAKEVGLG
ncbi:MAG: hypothetical protein ABSA90_10370 [Xanthobacteraceae bacterium]|jgi:hypothetical protein